MKKLIFNLNYLISWRDRAKKIPDITIGDCLTN